MAYQDTVTLTADASDLLILSSAAGTTYDPEPDARVAKVSGALTLENFTVSNGGLVSVTTTKPTLSGFQVFSGGKISGAAFAEYDTVVHSGGSIYLTGGSHTDLTIESGAYVSGLFTGATRLMGSNWHIESGAIFVNGKNNAYTDTNVYTDANGAIHNMPVYGAVHVSGGSLVDARVSSYLYMSCGTTVSGGVAPKGGFAIESGYLYNGKAYNTGKIWTQTTTAKISLGGAETRIDQGHWYHINCDQTTVQDTDLYAANGVLFGVKLVKSSYWLNNLTILEGLTISNPSVSNGGILTIGSAGIVTGANVYNGGIMSATADALVSGTIVVSSGGEINGGDFSDASASLHLWNGAKIGGATLNVAKEQLYFDDAQSTDAYVANGSLHNLTLDNYTLGITNGLTADDVTINAGGVLNVASGAVVSGANLAAGGAMTILGKVYALTGNALAGAVAVSRGGMLYVYDGVEIADAEMFAAGGITVYSGGIVKDTTATGGTFFVSSGGELKDTTIRGYSIISVGAGGCVSGATLDRAGATSAPHIKVSGGNARAEDITLSSGGIIYVRGDGFAGGVTVLSYGSAIMDGPGTISGAVLNDPYFDAKGNPHTALYMNNCRGLVNDVTVISGNIYGLGSGAVTNLHQSGAQVIMRGSGAWVSGAMVTGRLGGEGYESGQLYFQNGASGTDITVGSGGKIFAYEAAGLASGTHKNPKASDIDIISGGSAVVSAGGAFADIRIHSGGRMTVGNSGYVSGAVIHEGASAFITSGGSMDLGATSAWDLYVSSGATLTAATGAQLVNLKTYVTAHVNYVENKGGALIKGGNTNIAASTFYYTGAAQANGFSVVDGVVQNLGADGKTYRLSVGEDIIVDGAEVMLNCRISAFSNAKLNNVNVTGSTDSASVILRDNSELNGAVLNGGTKLGVVNVWDNAKAVGIVANAQTKIGVQTTTAMIDDTILKAGAQLTLVADANTGDNLTLDFTDGSAVAINDLARIAGSTTVGIAGVGAGTYTLGTAGALAQGATVANGLTTANVANGTTFTAAFGGMTYTLAGTTLTTELFDGDVDAAAALTVNGKTINTNDKAATWTDTTTYSGNVFLADDTITGNAWLDLDGFAASNANIYGGAKDKTFAGTVNINAEAGAIKNLAAGAGVGGKVGGVKLAVGDAMTVTGAVYAGGMGDVTGDVTTQIYGGTFNGNVFAGALCNYAANQTATETGDIALTVNGGTFKGNIYAGAAVKAAGASRVVHEAGDITVELNAGTASKQAFCLYGGGYAIGTNADGAVYTAGDVAISVAGGEWGTYLSGRGIFGGVYADTVRAATDDVRITVAGGTMGNIYGGGWAQNGGTSTVTGEVSITIAGDAQVANVFGGGSYSTTGGATRVGSVNILIAGGSVANNIYAGGQNEFSTVDGDISVTFTGAKDYDCNVYSYSYQANATTGGDKTLTFATYTGELSGNIGGFDAIAFEGDTAATLSGAAIDNDDWTFDYSGRTLDGATAAANFNGGTFAGDTLTLLLDATEAPVDWNIASGLADTEIGFAYDVSVGGVEQEFVDGRIASGDYAGWGFALEDSTLKFKHLA